MITSKSELLGRGVWDLACELLELPVWESEQVTDPIVLDNQQAALLGLEEFDVGYEWREACREDLLEIIRRTRFQMTAELFDRKLYGRFYG